MLRELTAADVPGAAVALANAYIHGRSGIKGDAAKAVGFYQAAATLDPDDQTANTRLAHAYRDGEGVPRNLVLASSHLETAAAAGSRMAIRELGLAYLHGSGVDQNANRAVELLHSSAERGFGLAWSDLAQAYGSAFGLEVDLSESFRFSLRGARAGDPSAMVATGVALLSGFGTQQDDQAGIFWLERTAEAEGPQAPEAMYRQSEVYRYGTGVKKDAAATVDWQAKAANAGSATAMFHTALDLQSDSRPSAKAEAIQWLRDAQALGHVPSIKKLNKMGIGTDGSPTAPAKKVEDDGVEE